MISLPDRLAKPIGKPHTHLLFDSARSPVGKPFTVDWRQLNYLIQVAGHKQVADKLQAPLITPWTPVEGALGRKSMCFDYTTILIFDLDKIDTMEIDEVIAWCGSHSPLVHTTFSHGVDGLGCFRVLMELDRPVNVNDYEMVHAALLASLPELEKRFDPTCAEPARCYFMPSCPPERHDLAEIRPSFGGNPIHVSALLEQVTGKPGASQAIQTSAIGSINPAAANDLKSLIPPPAAIGQRNHTLVSLAGRAYANGYTPEALMPEALSWGQRCTPAMDASEVMATVNSMWATHTRNHPQPIAVTPTPHRRLLTAVELANLPALEWLIKGLLPAKGLASIYGPSGSGKTFLALAIAIAIASRDPHFFGSKVKGCPVAYVALEGSGGISQRVKACELHRKQPAPLDIRFILGGFTLLEPHHAFKLAEEILATLGTGAVVIIDTLNQSAPGADENSSVDMGKIIHNAKILAEAVDGLVILVHHSGKDQGKGLRGHSSLHAAMDAVIEVVSTANGRAWRVSKSKDGESGTAHGFELVPYVVGQDDDGDDIRSCAVRPTLTSNASKRKPVAGRNQKAALKVLTDMAQNQPNGIPVVEASQKVGALIDCPSGRRATRAKELIDSLIESGHLESDDGHLFIP